MRGDRDRQAQIMLAATPEAFVPADHPPRRIKPLVDDCLARLSPRVDAMYAQRGRPSIPPEHLLKGSLAFTGLERQLDSPEGDTLVSEPVRRVPRQRR